MEGAGNPGSKKTFVSLVFLAKTKINDFIQNELETIEEHFLTKPTPELIEFDYSYDRTCLFSVWSVPKSTGWS